MNKQSTKKKKDGWQTNDSRATLKLNEQRKKRTKINGENLNDSLTNFCFAKHEMLTKCYRLVSWSGAKQSRSKLESFKKKDEPTRCQKETKLSNYLGVK